jgi:hypothetical protein
MDMDDGRPTPSAEEIAGSFSITLLFSSLTAMLMAVSHAEKITKSGAESNNS